MCAVPYMCMDGIFMCMCAIVLTVCWCCCGWCVVPWSREMKHERCVCVDGLCGTEPRNTAAAGSHDVHSDSLLMKPVLKSSIREIYTQLLKMHVYFHSENCFQLIFLSNLKLLYNFHPCHSHSDGSWSAESAVTLHSLLTHLSQHVCTLC